MFRINYILALQIKNVWYPSHWSYQCVCDNESVYNNATRVSVQLRKKHNSICFHRVRECVASGILFVHKVDTKHNLVDLLTKGLASEKRIFLRKRIMVDDTSM